MADDSTKRKEDSGAAQPGMTWTADIPSGKAIGDGHSSQLLPLNLFTLNLLLGLHQKREDGFTTVLESWLYFCCSSPMQSKASNFSQLLLSLL